MLPAAIGCKCVCCIDKRTEIESNATANRGLVKLIARRRIALQTVHVLCTSSWAREGSPYQIAI